MGKYAGCIMGRQRIGSTIAYGRYVDLVVDAVYRRAQDLADVPLDLHGRALALAARPKIAARASPR